MPLSIICKIIPDKLARKLEMGLTTVVVGLISKKIIKEDVDSYLQGVD